MAFWCIFFILVYMVFGMLSSFNFLMGCSCIAPLTLAVIMIRGLIIHPLFWMALIKGSCLVCFCVIAYYGNLSW